MPTDKPPGSPTKPPDSYSLSVSLTLPGAVPHPVLRQAESFHLAGQTAAALHAVGPLLLSPTDRNATLQAVGRFLEKLDDDARLAALQAALEVRPDSPDLRHIAGTVHLRIGERQLRTGMRHDAVLHLRSAFQLTGQHSWAYLVALAQTGEYQELLGLQERFERLEGKDKVPRGEGAFRQIALARMSLAVDRTATIETMHRIEQSPIWLDSSAVMAEFERAVRERAAFSYIRLGDGEARFLAYMDPAVEALLTWPERSSMMNSVWVNWFDQPVEDFTPHLASLHGQFLQAIDTADILGVLGTDSLIHDHYHFGFLAEMQRHLLQRPGILDRHLAAALGHHEMHHRDPWFAGLLQDLPFLGVVGCHPDLARRLAKKFGIADCAAYVVPGENGRPLPPETKGRGHFPDVFQRILSDLAVPHPGALFLVGAGLLGKIYCARVKELGGIAIDIGSLADAWMGFNTRPGSFDAIDTFRLPGN